MAINEWMTNDVDVYYLIFLTVMPISLVSFSFPTTLSLHVPLFFWKKVNSMKTSFILILVQFFYLSKNSNRAMNWINMSWLIGYLHTCLMFRIWGTAHNTTTIRKQSQVKSENPKSPISKHPSHRRDYKTQEKINYVVACN